MEGKHNRDGDFSPDLSQQELFSSYGILRPEHRQFLERLLGTSPRNWAFFEQALIHRSYLEQLPADIQPRHSNERLEFLGDALLGFLIGELLFWRVPALSEGDLTEIRSSLVNKKALAYCAERLHLGEYLFLGKGAAAYVAQHRAASILADAFEALLAAVYLDQGMDKAREFVLRYVVQPLQQLPDALNRNYKSALLEYVQARWEGRQPEYRVVDQYGPDHDRTYVVRVLVGGESVGIGIGKSKRDAEQQAAYHALTQLGVLQSQEEG